MTKWAFFFKFDENYKLKDTANTNHKKHEENYTEAHHKQILKPRDHNKILKGDRKDRHITYREMKLT